jgi:hypothetical protein
MKYTLNIWSADEVIQAYLDFIKNRNSKEVHLHFSSKLYGFKETMDGKLEIDDIILKQLPKKVQYNDADLYMSLERKDISLSISRNDGHGGSDNAEITFEDDLKKQIFNHFKEFEPKTID